MLFSYICVTNVLQIMKKADAIIYLDTLRPNKNGKCSAKIKITYNRKRKYFSTGLYFEPNEFEQIMFGKRKTDKQKESFLKLTYYLDKASKIIEGMTIFTFQLFEEQYLENRNIKDSVSYAFEKRIQSLKTEKRLSTAISYEYALKSLEAFKPDLTFADINKDFLERYESSMLSQGKSKSTIGIYLRSLRAIYNMQNLDKSIYPFGEGKNKYSIPTSRNIKKALTTDEIVKIYNYSAEVGSIKEMAKDYWIFFYLCNGMNVKDFCFLTWKNIDNKILTYKREKTKRSKKDEKPITVALKMQALEVIKKWGQPSIDNEAYIFPHLKKGMSTQKEMATYKQLTKTINKYIKQIASEVGIDKNVTTYYARHSFATVLKRSGANIQMISDLLGHSDIRVTQNYLDSFENEQIQAQTDVLTTGFKQAN